MSGQGPLRLKRWLYLISLYLHSSALFGKMSEDFGLPDLPDNRNLEPSTAPKCFGPSCFSSCSMPSYTRLRRSSVDKSQEYLSTTTITSGQSFVLMASGYPRTMKVCSHPWRT
ncbi:hypothetical protein DFH08DRAFT_887508 [Mycena albidolilacea]|uniref:Uncharacterized protein n=1 Tax=Mycena albidolilacea TaxID=1033008 RepID=A0AAD6ZHY0_9AGAR|nr:hypothetical protein DFH08DRAFT_887508 [Mycena albidolilacea]